MTDQIKLTNEMLDAAETVQPTPPEAIDLPRLVREFCEGQKWAVKGWKDQPHIKPLFDFANDQP
jgi:hypothetical protein